MSEQHTPGPWEILQDTRQAGVRGETVIATQFSIVARIAAEAEDAKLPGNQANARLIAAAPDMLDMLRAIKDEANRQYDDTASPFAAWIAGRANDAIAKAEGK